MVVVTPQRPPPTTLLLPLLLLLLLLRLLLVSLTRTLGTGLTVGVNGVGGLASHDVRRQRLAPSSTMDS